MPAGRARYGLTGMRERAELLGGSLTAGPTDTGFAVRLKLPAEPVGERAQPLADRRPLAAQALPVPADGS